MNLSTIQILERASALGLKLGVELPDTLTFQPVENCTPDFAETLKAHKSHLLPLLTLPFVMVFSEALGETIFFCRDEDTKATLIEAGAEPWSIYTTDELRILVVQNRIAPLSVAELRKLHEAKRRFNGRVTRSNKPSARGLPPNDLKRLLGETEEGRSRRTILARQLKLALKRSGH